MDIKQKLEILGDAAKYDVSCASSGVNRSGKSSALGSASKCGICHTWTDDGRCMSLLKILMSNVCVYDCAYCQNRRSNDVPRASFTPREIAELTIQFYRRNYIEGLFLSSAVLGTPEKTMELMIYALQILRREYRFGGYIHVKVIPGAPSELIDQIGVLADRVSVNMELPTKSALQLFAPDKNHEAIIHPMQYISDRCDETALERRKSRFAERFVPGGQSTQMIVGASRERDLNILRLSEGMYEQMKLKRVYYSAYIPVGNHPQLPALITKPPLLREHRLYQADWLMRFYYFKANEIVTEQNPDLDLELDPKCNYALNHLDLYPIEINTADYEMLLRIPGIGPKSARRIIAARKYGRLDENGLKKTGAVMKRAKYFSTVNGKYYGLHSFTPDVIRCLLRDGNGNGQISMLDDIKQLENKQKEMILINSNTLVPLLSGANAYAEAEAILHS